MESTFLFYKNDVNKEAIERISNFKSFLKQKKKNEKINRIL